MRYYETLEYQLSRGFKESEAKVLLDYQLDKLPYSYIKSIPFKERPYESDSQGIKYSYGIDEETGNMTVTMTAEHNYKKRTITFEVKRRGNEVNIITKTPREDTTLFHIRYNTNRTISLLSRRIKFHGREDEEIVESRFALFAAEDGSMLDYSEQKASSEMLAAGAQYRPIEGQYRKTRTAV